MEDEELGAGLTLAVVDREGQPGDGDHRQTGHDHTAGYLERERERLRVSSLTAPHHGEVEVGDGGEDQAGSDVEDAPEVDVEVGHGEDGDPDAEELGESLGVLEERREAPALTGVLETAGHQLEPVD